MGGYLFTGGRLLDVRRGVLQDGAEVLVDGGRIAEVSDRPIKATSATRIDLKGRTLMPGLIDCHVHLFLSEVDLGRLAAVPISLLTARAGVLARNMLMRGFTTVRDTGGADWGLKQAFADGLLTGPRLFIAGMAISQTGGHADFRRKTEDRVDCPSGSGLAYTARVADGVPEVVKAVRDELRKGADHIKIMASGGVASQSDPLESLQYRMDEMEAVCEEATRWGSYVAAHAYSAEAIKRAVRAGVRTIEHGNLVDEAGAALMAERGAFLVPTLVAYDAMKRRAREFGMSPYSMAKNDMVIEGGLRSLELCRRAGVEIAFGSDLLGQLQDDHCREFQIRREVMSPKEVLHSATIVGARVLGQEGRLGEVVAGAHADLLVVDGDPLASVDVFQDQGAHIPAIMKGGTFVKQALA